MAVTIQGVKIKTMTLDPSEKAKERVKGSYALMSNTDKVLATQSFNGYSDIEVQFSSETLIALEKFLGGVKKDLGIVLGLEEGEAK